MAENTEKREIPGQGRTLAETEQDRAHQEVLREAGIFARDKEQEALGIKPEIGRQGIAPAVERVSTAAEILDTERIGINPKEDREILENPEGWLKKAIGKSGGLHPDDLTKGMIMAQETFQSQESKDHDKVT